MKSRTIVLLLMAATLVPLASRAEKRTFIDQTGRPMDGELVTAKGDMVTIKRTSDGQSFTTKASNFSKADQDYFISKGGTGPAAANAQATVGSTSASIAPMRIEVKVYPNKSQKGRNGGNDDERIERISYRVDIRNGEQKRAFNGGKAVVMAFADNLQDRSESSVIMREEFNVSLEPLGSMSHDTKEAKLQFDNQGYKYGFKYSGYILVVKDAQGKSVTVSASSGTVAKFADEILKLSTNDLIDKNYKFVKKGPPRG